MDERIVTSLQNPLVKQLRKLHQAKGRQQQKRFLIEGTNLVEAACEVGYALDVLCYTETWQQRHPDLWQRAGQLAQRVERVSVPVMEALATTVTPDGVVATAIRQEPALPAIAHLGLALETLQDPGNLGTIIRTAAGAGVEGLWLSADSADADQPKVLRASAGLWFRLPVAVAPDLGAAIQQAKEQGIQVVAADPRAVTTYWQVEYQRPTLILLGNEGAGLSEPLQALVDIRASIPQAPGVESLNVAIAAALMVYEARRQRS